MKIQKSQYEILKFSYKNIIIIKESDLFRKTIKETGKKNVALLQSEFGHPSI